MKKFFTKTLSSKLITVCWVLFCLAATRLANAAPLHQARVSQVIQDVRLLEAHASPHPAVVNDKVTLGTAVRTGVESRAELTFPDLTITRLGANTIFTLNQAARELNLSNGTVLLQVPSGGAAVKANTRNVTVAVTGGTALLGTGPPTKFMVLEGIGTIYPLGHPEKAVTLHSGEMVIAEDGHISQPEKFDVKLVLVTSALIVDFAPLTNLPLILTVVDQQLAEQQLAGTTSQPPYKSFIDVIDVTDQSANSNPVVVQVRIGTPTPTPAPPPPTPSKFGTPSTITSPNPYLITSSTVITTDPSITTNGMTDFGKLYRGAADDGAFTLWAFGSTSAFDTALNLDTEFFADPNHLPIAVFKFQSLSLTGNPTIDLSNGGVTKLALIGVDGITSGPPGGTLTFTGLDLLVLATVNGSINLTSDVSFQGLNELAMYARGAGSNLTLNSPISGIGILELAAEGSIQLTNPGTMSVGEFEATAGNNLTLQIGGSLLLNGKVRLNTLVLPGTTVASGANVTLNVTGDYANSSATEFSLLHVRNEGAHIGTGGNINANIGGNLTAMSDFNLIVQNTNGQIDNGGNITVATGGSISTGGELNLLVENYNETANPAGHIGTGGNLSVTTGGNLAADFASIAINNRGGGMIDSGVNLTINVGGALTTLEDGPDFIGNTASLSVAISTRYDDTSGNTQKSAIGGDATLNLHADSASIGGNLSVFVSNRGGTIGGNALLNFNTTNDVTVAGTDVPGFSTAADIELLNDSGTTGVQSPFGGTIHGDATLQVSAANFTLTDPAGSLFADINNRNGGVIDSNASLSFNLAGNLTTQGSAEFDILNSQNSNSNGMPGGSIGAAATINFNAANVSVGADFASVIFNQRASGAPGPGAGSIGTDATVNTTMDGISAGGIFDVEIVNRNNGSGSGTGGSIGGNATINLNVANTLSSGGPAYIQIANESDIAGSPGGIIGSDATINVNATDITAGSLLAQIVNSNGGSIGGTANVALNATNNVSAPGPDGVTLQILNEGGHIGSGNAGDGVFYSVGGTTSTTGLTEYIDNSNGGVIDNGGNVTLHTVGPVMLDGGFALEVDNFNGGTINTGANVTAHFVGDVTATAGQFHSFNWYVLNGSGFFNPTATGGTIGTGGDINVTFDGNAATTGTPDMGSISAQIQNGSGGSIGTGGNISMTVGGNLASGPLFLITENQGGHLGTGGNMTLQVAGDITAQGDATFGIFNQDNGNGSGPGTIGLNATINVSATNISTGGALFDDIYNFNGGNIGGNAIINSNLSGDLTTQGDTAFIIANGNLGTIGGGATVNVTAANITANSLLAQIDNTGGSIGASTESGATINMNVSGSTTVTNDATVAIYGSDGATFAAININGGNYNVGQTFLSYIDGNGTIMFNNVTAHADVLKAGIFGANGVLNVAGGMLSADTELKLYAPGSNGQLNFVSNVTLGGNGLKILAANSVTIFDNVVVTIGGPNAADVYTNNANYTGFGGNGTTTGTFAGTGANNPQPLSNAPPFGAAPFSHLPRGTRTSPPIINVSNTDELLALLDGARVGPDGKIRISDSKRTNNLRNLGRIDMNGLPRGARRMLIHEMRDRSVTRLGNRRIL
jgi:hypothetical protein